MLGHELIASGVANCAGNDDVALVLAVLGVDQDVGPAVAGILDDLLGRGDDVGVEARQRVAGVWLLREVHCSASSFPIRRAT